MMWNLSSKTKIRLISQTSLLRYLKVYINLLIDRYHKINTILDSNNWIIDWNILDFKFNEYQLTETQKIQSNRFDDPNS